MKVEQVDFVSIPTRDVSRAVGGEVVGIEGTGVCQRGFVKDDDGNVLILHRRYAARRRREAS